MSKAIDPTVRPTNDGTLGKNWTYHHSDWNWDAARGRVCAIIHPSNSDWACSKVPGHSGDHAAYRRHETLSPSGRLGSWYNPRSKSSKRPVTDDDVNSAIASILGSSANFVAAPPVTLAPDSPGAVLSEAEVAILYGLLSNLDVVTRRLREVLDGAAQKAKEAS